MMSRSSKPGRQSFTREQVANGLALVAGVLGLAFLALALWRQIEPTRVWLDTRAEKEVRLRLEVEPPGTYIPYYTYTPDRARIRGGDTFAPISFLVENEATRRLCVEFDEQAARIEVRGMRLQTLFALRDWSAREMGVLFAPRAAPGTGIAEFQTNGDTLSIVTNGTPAAICSTQDMAAVLAELQRTDSLLLASLGILAIALFGLSVLARRHGLLPALAGFRVNFGRFLILGLYLYGCLRILSLTTNAPLIGYANTGDFFRLLACYGLEAVTTIDPFSPELRHAPIPQFVYAGVPIKEACYLSSQSFLIDGARAVNLFSGPNGWTNPFDVLLLGVFSSLLFCAVAGGLIALYTRVSDWFGLLLALCFALLLTDPFVTLFANTFLSEMSAVIFGTASIALAIYVLVARDWSLPIVTALALALFLFGTSRLQNLALPLAITFWLGLVALFQYRAVKPERFDRSAILIGLGIILTASVLAFVLQTRSNSRPGYMNALEMVNRADTYYGALLPALENPEEGLAVLGLDAKCAPYIGKTWYDMQTTLQECAAQTRELSQGAFLKLLWVEPAVVARLAPQVVDQTRPWIVDYVGQIEGQVFGRVDTRLPAPTWSLAELIHALPGDLYRALIIFLGVSAVVAGIVLTVSIGRRVPDWWVELALVQWLMTGIFFYIVLTALLGDGLLDFAKHTFFAKPALLVGVALGLGILYLILARLVRAGDLTKSPRTSAPTRQEKSPP